MNTRGRRDLRRDGIVSDGGLHSRHSSPAPVARRREAFPVPEKASSTTIRDPESGHTVTPHTSISDDTYQLVKCLLGAHDPAAAELLQEAPDGRVYVLSALAFCALRSSSLKARRASLESLRHLHPELCATACLGLALGKQFPLAREMGLDVLLELTPGLFENGKLRALEKHPQASRIERVLERPFEGKYEVQFLQLKSGEYIPDTLEDASRTASYARNSSPPGQAYGLLVLSNVEKDMAIDVAHRLFNSLNAGERVAFLAAIRAQHPGFGRALKLES